MISPKTENQGKAPSLSSDIRYFTKEKQFQPLPEVRVLDEMYFNMALDGCYVKN